MREITLIPVMNGFVVKAGCQCLAYQDKVQMKADIAAYIDDPDAAENEIIKRWGDVGTFRNRPVTAVNVPAPPPQGIGMGTVQPQNSAEEAIRR